MMNKSLIEWTDFTWNPVTGCLHGCHYCYAAKQARRFSGDVRLNKSSDQLKRDENGLYILDKPFKNQVGKVIPDPVGFEPIMHRYRLPMPAQKKKPAKIFVVSMGDLFGAWVPDSWIEEVFKACKMANIPVFMKDSLQEIWGESLIQEWPEGMPMDKGNDVPRCRECEHCTITQEGKRGNRHECEIGWQSEGYDDRGAKHIPGRYARTSPPWCPKREEEQHD